MSERRRPAPDIHVHVGRLVVDRAAIAERGARALRDLVSQRIAHRLESADATRQDSAGARPDLSDVIATAVAEHVSPQLERERRR